MLDSAFSLDPYRVLPDAGIDARRSPRRTTGRIALTSALWRARLVNLGAGGLAIETSRAPRIGEWIRLQIRIDLECGPPRRLALRRTFSGRVRWSRLTHLERGEDGQPRSVFRAGIELDRDPPPDRVGTGEGAAENLGFIDFSLPST